MAASVPYGEIPRRAEIPPRNDPHGWNSYDRYRTVHEIRLEQHPFVDHDRPDTVVFDDAVEGVIQQWGQVYCLRDVVLEVEKLMVVRYSGGQRRVRTVSFRYAAWISGGHPVLRYHNQHWSDDDYHHRAFDPRTGEQILHETLQRYQFPTFSEVLDELEIIAGMLDE